MLQNILNLNGIQKLTKTHQKTIHGGSDSEDCPPPLPGFYHCPQNQGEYYGCNC